MMKGFWRIVSLAGLLGLSACAKVEEQLKPVPLVKFTSTVGLKKVWSQSIGAGHDSFYNRFRVAAVGNTLYAADEDGFVTALDVTKGKTLWKHKLSKSLGGAVGAGEDLVLVGSLKGEVIALNAATGAELWQAQTTSSILTPPQTDGAVVIALSSDGRLFAFDAKTGKKSWSYDHALPILTYRTQATPLLVEGHAYVGFDNGQLLSFAIRDGQLRWATRVGQPKGRTELERVADVDSSPIVQGSLVYTASANGRIVAINRSTGRVVWSQNLSSLFDLALNSTHVFASGVDSHVFAYNLETGDIAWENKELHRRNLAAPGVLGDYVAVIDEDAYLHLLKASDGSFAARIKLEGSDHGPSLNAKAPASFASQTNSGSSGFHSPLITVGDLLVVFSDSGVLSAYQLGNK